MASMTTASYVYGALLIVGGVMGAAKGSTASLIAGGGSGVVICALEWALAAYPSQRRALGVCQAVLALTLLYVMGSRFLKTNKFMPAGLVAGMSGLLVLGYASRALSSATGAFSSKQQW